MSESLVSIQDELASGIRVLNDSAVEGVGVTLGEGHTRLRRDDRKYDNFSESLFLLRLRGRLPFLFRNFFHISSIL